MNEFKEFQGKNLDEAIEAACRHYDVKRDKLEIEILSGGSTGIFGLVGVKKAAVKARSRRVLSLQEMAGDREESQPLPCEEREVQAPKPAPTPAPAPAPEVSTAQPQARESREPWRECGCGGGGELQLRPECPEKPAPQPESCGANELEEVEEGLPRMDMTTLDPQILEQTVRQTVTNLLDPMLPEPKLSVEITPDRVNVFIEDEENSGLIIGREGQTLSSLQYLLNLIVARRMGCSVRIQIDTGEYRERQDEKLRLMALHLADKANTSGRTQSTKPLSSYHRRVVHVTLQDSANVFTRSKGEGPMKRVLVVPKRKNGNR